MRHIDKEKYRIEFVLDVMRDKGIDIGEIMNDDTHKLVRDIYDVILLYMLDVSKINMEYKDDTFKMYDDRVCFEYKEKQKVLKKIK